MSIYYIANVHLLKQNKYGKLRMGKSQYLVKAENCAKMEQIIHKNCGAAAEIIKANVLVAAGVLFPVEVEEGDFYRLRVALVQTDVRTGSQKRVLAKYLIMANSSEQATELFLKEMPGRDVVSVRKTKIDNYFEL